MPRFDTSLASVISSSAPRVKVTILDEILDEKFSKNSRKYTLGRGEGRVYTAIVSGYPNWPIGGMFKPTRPESLLSQHSRAELSGIHHRNPTCDSVSDPQAHLNIVG